ARRTASRRFPERGGACLRRPFSSSEETTLRRWAPESISCKGVMLFVESEAAAGDLEHRLDLLGENPFAALADAPFRVVEFAFPQFADAVHHLLFAVREMLFEPALEQRRDRPRQAQDAESGR